MALFFFVSFVILLGAISSWGDVLRDMPGYVRDGFSYIFERITLWSVLLEEWMDRESDRFELEVAETSNYFCEKNFPAVAGKISTDTIYTDVSRVFGCA